MSAPEPQQRGRSRTKRVLFALAVAAAFAALLEGALALLGLPRGAGGAGVDRLAPIETLDLRLYEPDARCHWRLRRSTVLVAPELGFDGMRTNAAGLRGAELPAPPPRDPRDLVVVCLGDSVTNGMNLGERETVPARLGAALAAALPARRVRVVNAGVPGHSFVQGARLFDELRALRPDVVVAWYGLNDAKPAMGVPDAEYRMPSEGAIRATNALRRSRIVRLAESLAAPAPTERNRAVPAETASAAARLAAAAAEDGSLALFVRGPTRLAEKEAQLERVLAAARAANATSVDGSLFCLSIYVAARPATEPLLRTDAGVAYLADAGEPRERVTVDVLAARLDTLRAWRKGYEAHLAALPADALDGDALLGPLAREDAFADCVHFTAAGAATVGDRLAAAIADALARRR